MTPSDMPKFAQLMYGLSEYYGKKLSDQVIDLYWRSLLVHDYADVNAAATRHMADPDNGQFMPKVADFKRHIGGSKQTQAMIAWTKVDKAVRQVGPWKSVCFDDPIINRVLLDMGGWISMCDTPSEKDLEFKMHEFGKRYQGYVLQGGASEYPKQLNGHVSATNAKNGHGEPEAILLGNPRKAKLVNEQGKTAVALEAKKASDVAASVVAGIVDQSNQGAA